MLSAAPSSSAYYEVDERIAARHAVTLAGVRWRLLCTQHALIFVAVERRSASIQGALGEMLKEIQVKTKPCTRRVRKALDPNYTISVAGAGENVQEEGGKDEFILPALALLANLAEKHRMRRQTLTQHSSLLELLELPSLMDTCVRSSLYEDALSIAGFANSLERRHQQLRSGIEQQLSQPAEDNNIAKRHTRKCEVVVGVVFEIRRREDDLRRVLIHRLRQNVTMPQCLEVVTALRRLNGVELERRNNSDSSTPSDHDLECVHAAMEMRLQVDFLEARDLWLMGGVNMVGSAQAAAVTTSSTPPTGSVSPGMLLRTEQILDGIEQYRTRCFEIVTQFLAIFRGSFIATSTALLSSDDHSVSLLTMWTLRRILSFLVTLSYDMLMHVKDTATLRDALDAVSFFASSMGRIGSDFQPLLVFIFEPRLIEMVTRHWNDGLNGMIEMLKTCRDVGIAGPLFGAETSTNSVDNQGDHSDRYVEFIQSFRTPAPPRKLLVMPALARFLNSYLCGFNELRRCLLPGTFPAIRLAQSKLIINAKMALQANERSVLTPGIRGEALRLREIASKMKFEFDGCLEPYMVGCLEVAFGSVDHAMHEAETVEMYSAGEEHIENFQLGEALFKEAAV